MGKLELIDGVLREVPWVMPGEGRVIEPKDIVDVREHMWPSPRLTVRTKGGRYTITFGDEGFDGVVSYIEENTSFRVNGTWIHRYLRFWYGCIRWK